MPFKRKSGPDASTSPPGVALEVLRARGLAVLAAATWPAALLDALSRLRAGGHQAYLVGGAVRDALLHREREPIFDVATDLRPEEVTARFERVEPIGVRHGTVLGPLRPYGFNPTL